MEHQEGFPRIRFPPRAVINTNKYTRMVSLPKIWLHQVGFEDGDKIVFEMVDGNTLLARLVKVTGEVTADR
jgi:hypothetical protein